MKEKVQKVIAIVLPVLSIAMVIYQLFYTQILLQDPVGHAITHLGLALVIVFLSFLLESKKTWHLKSVLLLAALVVTGYLMYFLKDILLYRTSIPAPSDLFIGVLIIIVLLAGNWLVFGKTFPIIACASIMYLVLGRYLPYPFTVPAVDFERLIMWLSIELGTSEGVYGNILDLSATYLFLFILFGSLLDGLGGTRFIIGLGRWVGSKLRGGAALTALFGSSLTGTVTGSTVANITITGSFTIPMMKKTGYLPEQAGAIEAAASNGGQIMPPIMGATAFVMAGFAGIPYIQIMVAAIIPALLYYLCVLWYIYLASQKMEIQPVTESVDIKQLLLDAPIFFLPLGVLIFLLVIGYTLPFVSFWSIVAMVIIGLISGILRKDARLDFKQLISTIVKGVRSASEIAMICALIGVVATAIKVSGLGIKLPLAIQDLSQGNLLIALLIAMLASIILGMGVPTTAAYLLVAIGAVPVLQEMGVSTLQAHLFCFIFAAFSHLTPPVAIGALVASKIAGGGYWETCREAIKAGFTAFLLPFFIIYSPVVILRPDSETLSWIIQIIAILIAIISIGSSFSNYFIRYLKPLERIVLITCGVLSLVFVFTRLNTFFTMGIILFIACVIQQFLKKDIRTLKG